MKGAVNLSLDELIRREEQQKRQSSSRVVTNSDRGGARRGSLEESGRLVRGRTGLRDDSRSIRSPVQSSPSPRSGSILERVVLPNRSPSGMRSQESPSDRPSILSRLKKPGENEASKASASSSSSSSQKPSIFDRLKRPGESSSSSPTTTRSTSSSVSITTKSSSTKAEAAVAQVTAEVKERSSRSSTSSSASSSLLRSTTSSTSFQRTINNQPQLAASPIKKTINFLGQAIQVNDNESSFVQPSHAHIKSPILQGGNSKLVPEEKFTIPENELSKIRITIANEPTVHKPMDTEDGVADGSQVVSPSTVDANTLASALNTVAAALTAAGTARTPAASHEELFLRTLQQNNTSGLDLNTLMTHLPALLKTLQEQYQQPSPLPPQPYSPYSASPSMNQPHYPPLMQQPVQHQSPQITPQLLQQLLQQPYSHQQQHGNRHF